MDEREFQELLRYQAMLSRQVVQEAKTDRKIRLVTIITSLTQNGTRKTQIAAVLHEAQDAGIAETESYDLLDELVKDRIIDAQDGYIAKR